MKRITILVNKDFEYAGFIEGLRDTVQVYAGMNGRDAECRFDNLIADIYCIQNLFKEDENSSHSELKYGYLKDLFKRNSFRLEDCDGVLSFSTSESTPYSQGNGKDVNHSMNGCVYVGNRFFLCDRGVDDTTKGIMKSQLKIGNCATHYSEYYVDEPIHPTLYHLLHLADMRFERAYNNSAAFLRCIASKEFSSVGVVNVMDYSCYAKADEAAYKLFFDYGITDEQPIGIETTHGVVVKAFKDTCDDLDLIKHIPVNFISPIVDRYLKFDEDVDGKYGKQNFICSYNGGVVTGHILKILNWYM